MATNTPTVAEWKSKGAFYKINGHKVFAIDEGDPHKECIIILHGFPSCTYDYYQVLPILTQRYRVILHDHIGFGLSGRPLDFTYSLVDQASIAQQLWQTLGIKKAHLLAHDYGTSVATEIITRHNEGNRPVEITSATIGNGSMLIEMAGLLPIQRVMKSPTLGPIIAKLINQSIFNRNMRKIWHDKSTLHQSELDNLYHLIWSDPNTVKIWQKIASYVDERHKLWHRWITDGLYKTDIPIHLLWADKDPIAIIEMAHQLHKNIANSQLDIIENVGHYPMLEAPKIYADRILKALAKSV